MFNDDEQFVKKEAVIKVIGVGGGGGNAVDRMIENGVRGVEFVSINTDFSVLQLSKADERILIGKQTTKGLGAGTDPKIGEKAAEEQIDEIREVLSGTDMVFITTGMGGGTGSGATPIIARVAKEEMNILTIGIVTKPFGFEGVPRMNVADEAINKLRPYVDALIVIPNDRLLQTTQRDTSYLEAFRLADNVIRQAVQGIVEIVHVPGVINVDFADVRKLLANAGTALMGIGAATGSQRTKDAAMLAIKSPLLESSISGATTAIINISSSINLSLYEIQDVVREVKSAAGGGDLTVKTGLVVNPELGDEVIVTIIATGFKEDPFLKINTQTEDFSETEIEEEKEEYDAPKDKGWRGLFGGGKKKKEKKDKKKDSKDEQIPSWLQRK